MNIQGHLVVVVIGLTLISPITVESATTQLSRPVARVLKVEGTVMLKPPRGAQRPAKVFGTVYKGSRLTAEAGASVVLAFRQDGHREQVRGPVKTTVGETGCEASDQVQPLTGPPKSEAVIRQTVQQMPAITRGGVTWVRNPGDTRIGGLPPGLIMKKPPVPFIRFCSTSSRPLLRWPAVPGVESYRFRLIGPEDQVWSTQTSETSVTYAGPEPLKPSESGYLWEVSCPGEAGESKLVCKGCVKIPSEEEARHAAALQELGKDADEAILTLNVIWYLDHEMLPAALEAVERLAEKDNNEPAYHQKLAILYDRLGQPEKAKEAKQRAETLAPADTSENGEQTSPIPDAIRKFLESQNQ
jgi:hypothetical protein